MSMSDSIRRMLERDEALRHLVDPLGDARRLIDPLGGAYDRLGIGAETMHFLQQEEERRKLLSGILGEYPLGAIRDGTIAQMAEEAVRNRKLLEGPIEEARQLGLLDPHSDVRRSMAAALEARQTYEQLFRRPELADVNRLAREALGAGTLAASVFGDARPGAALEAAMAAMQNPWARIEHMDRSARAFAEMQAMGRILNDRPPFEATLAVSLRPSLGDWRDILTPAPDLLTHPLLRSGFYLERGFDPALTDFPVPAFEESIDAAGLRERRDEAPEVIEGENIEDGFTRARDAFDQLQRFEIAIRRFIATTMHTAYGEHWMKHQLPSGMMDAWRAKRDTAVKAGEVERPLIDYADFTDYRQIIERGDNWKTVFKPIFGRPEDVRESFQRLFPVRIATMHSRVVTLDDELLLVVETKRVLQAIKKAGT